MARRAADNRFIFAVGLALFTLSAILWTFALGDIGTTPTVSAVVIVFVLASAAEIRPLRIRFGDHSYALVPYELAQVVGLFLLSPRWLVALQLLASVTARIPRIRRSPAKALLNSSLAAFALIVLLLLTRSFGDVDASLRSWAAIVLGVAASQVVSNTIVMWIVSRIGQEVVRSEIVRSVALYVAISMVLATATWTVLALGLLKPGLLIPAGLLVAALTPFISGALKVVRRANGYERLLRFTTAVVGPDDDGKQLRDIVTMMRGHLSANEIRMVFQEHADDGHVTVVRCTDETYTEEDIPAEAAGDLWALRGRLTSTATRFRASDDDTIAWLDGSESADVLVTRNSESVAVWACVGGDEAAAEEGSDDSTTVKFPAMAEQVFTWLALQRHIRESEYLASHDPLTGLANRELLRESVEEAVEDAIARDRAPGAAACGVMILDLDGFKLVNDSWGHAVGDQLLIHVARGIESVLPPAASLGRLSGDEFAMLVPSCTPVELEAIARRVAAVVARPFEPVEGVSIETVASIGMALAPQDATDASRLLHLADSAMYSVKASGAPERIARYEAVRDGRTERRAEIKKAIETALASDAIRIMYQPLYHLESDTLVKFEALARMSPDGVELSPADFIPVAESTGLIHQLTARVFDIVCRQLVAWSAWDVKVAVNLSVHNLMDRNFADHVARALMMHGVDPARLVCEVTESTVMRDLDTALATLERIRALGVAVSIDDFGTGHSSMQYLSTLPVDEVKIDRSFVNRATVEPVDAAVRRDLQVLEGLISLCRRLDLTVTVEGLETTAAVRLVESFGAQLGQGYVLSRPLALEAADALLRERGIPAGARPVAGAC
jgi:diguanylate cyclase (GGDEF)-like protein